MELSFERLWSLFLNKLKFILLFSVIAALATYIVCDNFIDKKYTSSSALLIKMSDEGTNSNNELTVSKGLVENYKTALYTDNFFTLVAEKVLVDYNIKYTPRELKQNAEIKVGSAEKNSSSDFSINYTCTDPYLAQSILEIITKTAVSYISDNFSNEVMVIEDPMFPDGPSSPKTIRNSVYAFLIVFILVVCFYFFREISDDKIKNVRDITGTYDIFVLGVVPDYIVKKPKAQSYHSYYANDTKEDNGNG